MSSNNNSSILSNEKNDIISNGESLNGNFDSTEQAKTKRLNKLNIEPTKQKQEDIKILPSIIGKKNFPKNNELKWVDDSIKIDERPKKIIELKHLKVPFKIIVI